MVGLGQAAATEAYRRHAEVAAVLLDHDVGRQLGGAEDAVERSVHPAGLVDALVIDGIAVLPASGELHERLLVRGITVDLVRAHEHERGCLLYTSPSPRDRQKSRMPSSA